MCTEICCHLYRNADTQHGSSLNSAAKTSEEAPRIGRHPIAIANFPSQGVPAGPCQFALTSSSWPLNCTAANNCRRARVTLPTISYSEQRSRNPWGAYRLCAQLVRVARPQFKYCPTENWARGPLHLPRRGPLFWIGCALRRPAASQVPAKEKGTSDFVPLSAL